MPEGKFSNPEENQQIKIIDNKAEEKTSVVLDVIKNQEAEKEIIFLTSSLGHPK